MTILQMQPVAQSQPAFEPTPQQLLSTAISKALAAHEEDVERREQIRRRIEQAKSHARKKGIRLPEVVRWDTYGYDDFGETIITLVRYELQSRPQRWLPVFEPQYQWEIPGTVLSLTLAGKITRPMHSLIRNTDRRELLPFDHPLIPVHIDALLEGLAALRMAFECSF